MRDETLVMRMTGKMIEKDISEDQWRITNERSKLFDNNSIMKARIQSKSRVRLMRFDWQYDGDVSDEWERAVGIDGDYIASENIDTSQDTHDEISLIVI